MKHVRKLVLFMLLGLLALPLVAQEPGSGGVIIEPNFGDDIRSLNPITNTDGPSDDLIQMLFPKLIDHDHETASWLPGAGDSLATGWEISEDGTIYTFTLRDDWFWSDGTQVTAADLVYHYDAIQSGAPTANAALRDNVVSITAPDDFTLVVEFASADCTALDTLIDFFAVPSHVWTEVFGDDYENMDSYDYNLNPTVTGAEFVFGDFRPGEQTTLLANPDFPNAELGVVIPAGHIDKIVTDQVVQMELFYAGELNYVNSVPQAARAEARERAAAGEIQLRESPSVSIRFLSFNTGDPSNPQDGVDEDGNIIDQGNHPIFGDARVRQALRYAMDFDAVNEGAFFGEEYAVDQMALPTSWAYNEELGTYPYDPDRAAELLDEAGWIDSDGDGVRECNGCLYAEEGTPLAFDLQTNAGNTSQEALYTILQDQWTQLGADVNLRIDDFNVILDGFLGQTYDAVGLFLSFSTPDNPNDLADIFTPQADVLGSGFNTGSYANEEVSRLLAEARTLPGCDLDERAELYRQVQEILHEELPWMFISSGLVPQVANNDIENWDPRPGSSRWNIDAWMRPGE